MKAATRYIVYASVWHIPPPVAKVKSDLIGVFDRKGRLVEEVGESKIDEYFGRYSKKVARKAVAFYLNGQWESNVFTGEEVILATREDVEKKIKVAPAGGFHAYVAGEHVPQKKVLYLKAIYSRYLPNAPEVARPVREGEPPDVVPTTASTTEADLKRSLIQYLTRKYQWHLNPEEIHLISAAELKHLRKEAKEWGYD